MESKNIKVIDEHNIDRIASIICAIDVDGTDYVVYSIERDDENDNIFISKLLKNINETSNMINIDDSMEKDKLSSLVKELIKYAVNTEKNKLDTDKVNLLNGKQVDIISATIDKKEQNINVQKTYITTVKKSITKVSRDFYDINVVNESFETPVDNIFPDFSIKPEEIEKEVIDESNNDNLHQESDIIMPSLENIVLENVDKKDEEIIPNVVNMDSIDTDVSNNFQEEKEAIPEISILPEINPAPVIPPITPLSTIDINQDVASKIETPMEKESAPKLVFDGSKETNLKEALGNAESDNVLSTENVEPIREFGIDEEKVNTLDDSLKTQVPIESDTGNTNAGFANNKFFMVIAILFFVAACVFLGYEAFRYFQLTK